MARYYVEKDGEWNIFSTVVDDFLFDEFICLDALKARLLYERFKELTEDIDSLMTDKPKVNVMPYEEAVRIADRKTENCSEKPNNCETCRHHDKYGCEYPCDECEGCDKWEQTEATISKMEQVETMSCAECKHRPIGAEICEEPCHYEPQTDWHYDEQDATWYPYKHEDEPQQKSCATCKHALGNWDGESNNCGRCCGADRRFYEPKDEQNERSE